MMNKKIFCLLQFLSDVAQNLDYSRLVVTVK